MPIVAGESYLFSLVRTIRNATPVSPFRHVLASCEIGPNIAVYVLNNDINNTKCRYKNNTNIKKKVNNDNTILLFIDNVKWMIRNRTTFLNTYLTPETLTTTTRDRIRPWLEIQNASSENINQQVRQVSS